MLNQVIIQGNIVRDLEEKKTGKIAKSSIAYNRKYKNNNDEWVEETSFFELTVFGNKIEKFKNVIKKGNPVVVYGKLTENKWENSKGEKRKRIEIIVTEIIELAKKQKEK